MTLDQGIAYAGLLVAICALVVSVATQQRQPELIKKQIEEIEDARAGKLGARVTAQLNEPLVGMGPATNCFIRVTNNGPAEAREIHLVFNGNSPLDADEARRKLPIPVLQPDSSFDLKVWQIEIQPPYHATLKWTDGLGEHRTQQTLG